MSYEATVVKHEKTCILLEFPKLILYKYDVFTLNTRSTF